LKEIEDSLEDHREHQGSAENPQKTLLEKLEDAPATIPALTEANLALEKRIDASKADIGDMQLLLEDAEAASKRWESEAKSRSKDIDELEKEIETERDNARKLKLTLGSKIKELELQVEMGGPGGGASAADLKQLQEELTRIRQELSDARDVKTSAERSLQAVANERDQYKQQFEQADTKASKYLKDVRKLQNDYDEAFERGGTAQAAREILQKKNEEYLKEINDLKNQLVNAQIRGGVKLDLDSLQKDNVRLKDEVTSLGRKLRIQEIEQNDLKPRIDDLTYQLEQEKLVSAKYNAQLKDKEKMLMERELANARLIQTLTDTNVNEKKELLTNLQEFKEKNDELTRKNATLNEEYDDLLNRFTKLKRGGT